VADLQGPAADLKAVHLLQCPLGILRREVADEAVASRDASFLTGCLHETFLAVDMNSVRRHTLFCPPTKFALDDTNLSVSIFVGQHKIRSDRGAAVAQR
jgi:hypothetical protein